METERLLAVGLRFLRVTAEQSNREKTFDERDREPTKLRNVDFLMHDSRPSISE